RPGGSHRWSSPIVDSHRAFFNASPTVRIEPKTRPPRPAGRSWQTRSAGLLRRSGDSACLPSGAEASIDSLPSRGDGQKRSRTGSHAPAQDPEKDDLRTKETWANPTSVHG